jgi:molybdenum cofactor guanylyltransferase
VNTLLELRNLRKSVGGQRLLDIPSLCISENTCIVLTGRNGAGKTTLLKILAGLQAPDHAGVVFHGASASWANARQLLRRHTVYLHQDPYMFDRSVADNIAYGLRNKGLPSEQIRRAVEQALDWAGILHLAGRNARQLSGGEKQRVAMTRARVLAPRLLLLDEPMANMDLESRQQSLDLIRRLKSDGITAIVTSHEPYISEVIGDEHLHLCSTGPFRHGIVHPFLYQRDAEQRLAVTANATRAGGPLAADMHPRCPGQSEISMPIADITGVILAGGRAQRMGGMDKGLIPLNGKPMVEHILDAVRPQVGTLLINANRNLDDYARYGLRVVTDRMGEFYGPLVGMASALEVSTTPYLLTVPCDSPLIPADLATRLYQKLREEDAEISVVHDGERMQPVFALLHRDLLPSLLAYLDAGGRKIDTWYAEHRLALADFSDRQELSCNVNTPDEQARLEKQLKLMANPSPA